MKKQKRQIISITAVFALVLTLTACSGGNVSDEIKLPIYEANNANKFSTVEVKRMDLEEKQKMAASIGYACSDSLSAAHSGNLVSINVSKYQEIKEGDIIAVIDSSDLDYDFRRQEIMANAAYDMYLAERTEEARLNYEYEKALLDEIQYNKDSYTLRAPYDCIITDLPTVAAGVEMEEGTYICSVAPVGDVFVYIETNPKIDSPFKLGKKVSVTLTGKSFEGTVVSVPDSDSYRFELQYSSVGAAEGGYETQNMNFNDFESKKSRGWGNNFSDSGSNPVGVDSSRNIFIRFEPEVLAELLEETPNAVKAGWATVEVVTRKVCGVLAVPSSAIVTTDTTYVYLYQNGQRLMTPVTTGETISGYTVIVSGVSEGDKVVN